MTDENILIKIPGEILGRAGYALPDAAISIEQRQTVTVRLPDGNRAKVTFLKLKSKKGKNTRWFWTPEHAELIDEIYG